MGKPLPPIMGGKQSTTPSPAPASGNSTATTPSTAQNAGGPVPGVLLGISGGWLVARMFLFGGALWLLEIIAISVTAGFAHSKGSKGQKKFATAIIAVALLNLLIPRFNPWVKRFRESQLNPPPPTEQSAGQEQVATAPATVEEIPSTERMVWGGEKIVLTGDGEYLLPKGKKSLCITALGMKDGSSRYPQNIDIGGTLYSELGSGCKALNPDLSGKIIVDFSPGKPWGTKAAILNIYKEYDSKPGGIGQLPFIAIGM